MSPPTRASTRTDAERIHLPVAVFFSRLRVLTQLLGLRNNREIVRQILSQGQGMKEQPLLRSVERDIGKLFEGCSRIYKVAVGNAVNLRQDSMSMRSILPAVSDLAVRTLEGAYGALNKASSLSRVRYWLNPMNGDDPVHCFDLVMREEVCSPDYLRWALSAAKLPPRDQRAIRRYADAEVAVFALQQHDEGPDPAEDHSRDDLAVRRGNLSAEAAALITDRVRPTDGEWGWLKPPDSGSNPWPFPGRLRGYEDAEGVLAEAAVLDRLGHSLAWPPFDGMGGDGDIESDDDCYRQYAEAIEAWSTSLDAALALRYLAAVLRALVQAENVPHCQVCYRYTGQSRRRTRCTLHVSTASERTRALRLALYTGKFNERRSALRLELADNRVCLQPAQALTDGWRFGAAYNAWAGTGSHPVTHGRWPSMDAGEAAKGLADGLHKMVVKLASVVGLQLRKRMVRLENVVLAHVCSVVDAPQLAASTRAHPGSRGRRAPAGDHQSSSEIKAAAGRIEDALRLLTPPGFFGLWFGGAKWAAGDLRHGTDLDHPLLRACRPATPRSAKKPDRQESQQTLPGTCDLQQIVGDLVSHRAWLECGGEEADAAIEQGQPVPTKRARGRIDVNEALRLRHEEKRSFREIGAMLGVTGPAVYLALKKLVAEAPPAEKTRRRK